LGSSSPSEIKVGGLGPCGPPVPTPMSLGQTKVNKVKIFLPFLKFMKRPQTKFHAHTKRESQVIRSKKVKIYH